MKNRTDPGLLDIMHKDPKNWKGFFYFNRKDYRLIVPKLNPGMGSTLNFASPYSYLFIILIVLIAVTLGVLL